MNREDDFSSFEKIIQLKFSKVVFNQNGGIIYGMREKGGTLHRVSPFVA